MHFVAKTLFSGFKDWRNSGGFDSVKSFCVIFFFFFVFGPVIFYRNFLLLFFLFLFFEAILFACGRKYSVGHFGEFLGCRAAVNLCKKSGLPLRRCASYDEPVCKRIAKNTRYHIEFLTCFFFGFF